MSAQSSVKKPDFAFPQTVAKDAQADLKAAEQSNDAHAAINALIRIYIGDGIVDPTTVPQSIKLVGTAAEKFKESPLYALFLSLQAQLLKSMYNDDRWTYDRRELPLTPLPEDLTEWSGEQFASEISRLNKQAIYASAPLANCLTKDYTDIIEANELTQTYYTTLRDFVFQQAIGESPAFRTWVSNDENPDCKDLIKQAYEVQADKASAAAMLWKSVLMKSEGASEDEFQQAYLSYPGNQYAAILLVDYCDNIYNVPSTPNYRRRPEPVEVDADEMVKRQKWAVAQIDSFISKFPNALLADQLKAERLDFLRKEIRANIPEMVAGNTPFDIKIFSTNANVATISVYPITDAEKAESDIYKLSYFAKKTPIITIPVNFAGTAPFQADSTVQCSLPSYGYFAIVPTIPGETSDTYNITTVRSVPALPIGIDKDSTALVIVADAIDGKPMKGIKVTPIKKDWRATKVLKSATTDSKGIADITKSMAKAERCDVLRLGIGKKDFDFQTYIYLSNTENAKVSHASVLTDRALYHPGETLNALIVVSSSVRKDDKCKSFILANKEIKATLYNTNFEEVDSVTGTTDEFGRLSCQFALPEKGLTGRYTIRVGSEKDKNIFGQGTVTVSDYKMPDFEIKVVSTSRNVPAEGDVTIKGNAKMYSGMPLANAEIEVVVSKSSFFRFFAPEEKVYSTNVTTDANGDFTVLVPASATDVDKNAFSFYIAQLDATSPSGSSASTATSFNLGKEYMIQLTTSGNVDALKPFNIDATAIGPDGEKADLPLRWAINKDKDVIAQGDLNGAIDISGITPGEYELAVSAQNEQLADTATTTIKIYNTKTDIVPTTGQIWLEKGYITLSPTDNKVDVLYGTTADDAYIYFMLSSSANKSLNVNGMDVKKGYHTLSFYLPDDFESGEVAIITMRNCETERQTVRINRKKPEPMKIVGESFRDNLVPGSQESWRFRIVGKDGKAAQSALVLDMYNKALDALQHHSLGLYFPSLVPNYSLSFNTPRRNSSNTYFYANYKAIDYKPLEAPEFNFYDMYVYSISRPVFRSYPKPNMKMRSHESVECEMDNACEDVDLCMASPETMEKRALDSDNEIRITGSGAVPEENEAEQSTTSEEEKFDYRDADVPLAIWAPILTTDAEGNLYYSFTVPNANTTWALKAVAWNKNMETASLMREFVASKPVMVQPNTPRFLRAGDKAVIAALVMNNTETAQTVKTTVEIFDPVSSKVVSVKEFTNEIPAQGSTTVKAEVYASPSESALGYRVRTTNGQFSDGEQSVISILPSMASLIETDPFYLNPGETEYATKLPNDKDARISLTFSENPVWTIVSALPGLRKEICNESANSAAAAIFSAKIALGIMADNPHIATAIKEWLDNPSDSALVSMLEKNEDLKQAVLSATPWVQAAKSDSERMANLALIFSNKDCDKSIEKGFDILKDLQRPDGGWAWANWCDKSSSWITGNVLGMFAELQRLGFFSVEMSSHRKMIEKAIKFWDSKVEDKDINYAIVRPAFTTVEISANGTKVIDATLAEIEKKWKSYTDPAYKAMAAEALFFNDNTVMANELMRSISEFGVWTKNQGLKFPSVNALYNYAILLEAYATILPDSKEVDGLRQQLIVRKQATNWGSAVVTSEVVTSILTSGTRWTVPAKGAEIFAGDTQITPQNNIEKYTGSLRADLSPYAGKELKIITPGTGPAYGAVYAQFKQEMQDVKASSCDDLSIEKTMFVRRGTEWIAAPDSLSIGDRVKVQLTIKTKRNLQYVTIIDERPAAFEPVDQLPGWMWSEGTGFYRENRDSSTNLFVSYMSPNTYLLTYEMNVAIAGTFSSGVATAQSQYAPEISAHSAGTIVRVK